MPDPTSAPPPFPSAVAEPPDPRGEPPAPISPVRRQRWWAPETRRTPDRPCLNCGDTTVGFFCRNCGQRKADVRVSLRRDEELGSNYIAIEGFSIVTDEGDRVTVGESVYGREESDA